MNQKEKPTVPTAEIVVVDDEPHVQLLLKRLIERRGHEVVVCSDGRDGLEAIHADTDLVLLDMMMPGMDGLSVLKALKEDPETAEVPVIMITALSERGIRLDALKAGASDFLTKPVDLIELQARMDSQLRSRWAHKEVQRYSGELEELVRARTKKLADANLKLQTEIADRIKVERSLLNHQRSLRELTAQLAYVEEQERRNIVADLHDRVCQSLAIVQIRLEQLGLKVDEEHRDAVDHVVGMVEGTITDLRTLMYEISPQSLYELGLVPALEELAEQFDSEHEMDVTFSTRGAWGDVPHELRGVLYRAVRELMINAIKHARCSSLMVTMVASGRERRIVVEDDGRGFSYEDVKQQPAAGTSFGLLNLEERMRFINGRVEVVSSPGKGTIASIFLDQEQE